MQLRLNFFDRIQKSHEAGSGADGAAEWPRVGGRMMRDWNTLARNREARLARTAPLRRGKIVGAADARTLLERVLEPGDRVCLEGNNQKQADFLAKALASVDPASVHDLHIVQSVLALPE